MSRWQSDPHVQRILAACSGVEARGISLDDFEEILNRESRLAESVVSREVMVVMREVDEQIERIRTEQLGEAALDAARSEIKRLKAVLSDA